MFLFKSKIIKFDACYLIFGFIFNILMYVALPFIYVIIGSILIKQGEIKNDSNVEFILLFYFDFTIGILASIVTFIAPLVYFIDKMRKNRRMDNPPPDEDKIEIKIDEMMVSAAGKNWKEYLIKKIEFLHQRKNENKIIYILRLFEYTFLLLWCFSFIWQIYIYAKTAGFTKFITFENHGRLIILLFLITFFGRINIIIIVLISHILYKIQVCLIGEPVGFEEIHGLFFT